MDNSDTKGTVMSTIRTFVKWVYLLLILGGIIAAALLSYQIGRLTYYFSLRANMEEIDSIAAIMKEIQLLYDENYIGSETFYYDANGDGIVDETDAELIQADDIDMEDIVLSSFAYSFGDKYGFYMSPIQSETSEDERYERLTGIGVEIVYEETHGFYVSKVYNGSPAEKAGIEKGDYIVAADGKYVATEGKDAIIDIIAGEEGTSVSISIIKASELEGLEDDWVLEDVHIQNSEVSLEGDTNTSEITEENTENDEIDEVDGSMSIVPTDKVNEEVITRQSFQMNSVDYEVINTGEYDSSVDIGLITIDSFTEYTDEEFKEAIEYFKSVGISDYIIDLRGNTGGTASSVIECLDYCLPEGLIVEFRAKQEHDNKSYYSDSSEVDGNFTILVNGATASASELFAQAMKDYGKAKIVGVTTFGKGTVLSTYGLSNGGTITLSTAKYYTISGHELEGNGVEPDYEIDLTLDDKYILYKLPISEDEQMLKAIEVANEQAKS